MAQGVYILFCFVSICESNCNKFKKIKQGKYFLLIHMSVQEWVLRNNALPGKSQYQGEKRHSGVRVSTCVYQVPLCGGFEWCFQLCGQLVTWEHNIIEEPINLQFYSQQMLYLCQMIWLMFYIIHYNNMISFKIKSMEEREWLLTYFSVTDTRNNF